MPSYGRFDITLTHGQGSHVWDAKGNSYLDLGGGIAVNTLGHAHPELVEAVRSQASKLMHISNLYFSEPQANLASSLSGLFGGGKVFFSNSGAEANEGLYKLARKFGSEEGRFEIITANNSFHGRTLGGISATGQEKIKKYFYPMVQGFKHVPFNDLEAVKAAVGPQTVAVLIEGIQGEGGIMPATPEYLLGLRQLCDERKMLLLMDSVQCGHFRSGKFQSYQRILEGVKGAEGFAPDAVSMAKSLGGGFPIGAFWVREAHQDLLSAGTHGTTYGGNPLACATALKVLEIVQRDKLDANAYQTGEYLTAQLRQLSQTYPNVIKSVRGLGLMLGLEIPKGVPGFANVSDSPALAFVKRLQSEHGVLTVPSGDHIVRLLPALNLSRIDADEGLDKIHALVHKLAAGN